MGDAVWLSERDVIDTIDLLDAVDAVEGGLRQEGAGSAATMDKTHLLWDDGATLHAVGGALVSSSLVGTKTWAHTGAGATPLLVLWDAGSGELRAVVEAFALGQLRTGAMTGVAVRWLASDEAASVAVIGTGKQALPQLAAVAAVRPIRRARVFSPSAEHRERFAARVLDAGLVDDVVVCDSVESAAEDAPVVVTATRARQPFLTADAVAPGALVAAIGAITPERAELAPDLVARAGAAVVDSVSTARGLAAELPDDLELVPLSAVVAGVTDPPRGSGDGGSVTLFKAMGIGLADVSLGAAVLDRAVGRGRPIEQPERAAPRLRRS